MSLWIQRRGTYYSCPTSDANRTLHLSYRTFVLNRTSMRVLVLYSFHLQCAIPPNDGHTHERRNDAENQRHNTLGRETRRQRLRREVLAF